ncbi:MAG TPA: hypothetical protein DER07_00320 [Armatimonadetes bacterium]|nr:hypothetical protein [Armatimonadota bacterium]
MKRFLLPALGILATLAVFGCSSETQLSKDEEAKIRDSLEAGKGEFDINKVPPEMREKVRGIIESQKGGGPAAPPAPK